MTVLELETSLSFQLSQCPGDIQDSNTQCCFCCGELSNVVDTISSNNEDYCRVGCLGYLNITCDIFKSVEGVIDEDTARFCSYGEKIAKGLLIDLDESKFSCTENGNLEEVSLTVNPTISPSFLQHTSPPTTREVLIIDQSHYTSSLLLFTGGAFLSVLGIILLATAIVLLKEGTSKSIKDSTLKISSSGSANLHNEGTIEANKTEENSI